MSKKVELKPGMMVRSKLVKHVGLRARVYKTGPDETEVQWLVDTRDGDWGGSLERVKTRNLVPIRRVETVTYVDVIA